MAGYALLHENGEPGQCPLINRVEEVPLSKDSGFRVSNTLTLIEDGPRLVTILHGRDIGG